MCSGSFLKVVTGKFNVGIEARIERGAKSIAQCLTVHVNVAVSLAGFVLSGKPPDTIYKVTSLRCDKPKSEFQLMKSAAKSSVNCSVNCSVKKPVRFSTRTASLATRFTTPLKRVWSLLLLLVLVSCSPEPELPVVEFNVDTDQGRFFSEQYQDKVVYLDFWATWCAPCRASFPWMNEMLEKYQADGLQIIAVSIDADRAQAKQFAIQLGAKFDIGYDPQGLVADMFDVKAMPTSAILGPGGKLLDVHQGFNEGKKPGYEESIVAALKTLQ